MHICFISVLIAFMFVTGCGVNPVTGKREFRLVSEAEEINLGKQNYLPSQQSQGSVYIVDKNLSQYVSAIGRKLAKASDRPNLPYEFVVLNNSVPNAWALPGGKIAVNRGLLLELKNEAELAAVLSHEIVHAAARHGAKSMERGLLLNVGMLGIGIAAGDKDNANLIVGAASIGSGLINSRYGREAELESDLYGIKYMAKAGYDPRAAVSLQETFLRLAKGNQASWLEGLFASHPPSQERVDTNRRTAAAYGAAGKLGLSEYQQKIASLVNSKPAYDALDEGRKALAKDNTEQALTLANKAIKIEPKEAIFYALKGDAQLKKKQAKLAEKSYNEAIKRNSNFFMLYLNRGIIRKQLGKNKQAEQDLQKSTQLLPTESAHYQLGNLALSKKNKKSAMEHYAKAAGSKSNTGKNAAIALTKLDLPTNPSKYIATTPRVDSLGRLGLNIMNHSAVAVSNIEIDIRLVSPTGTILLHKKVDYTGNIAPNKSKSLSTKLVIPTSSKIGGIKARVTKASIVE